MSICTTLRCLPVSSLSARRAWIEMGWRLTACPMMCVALRKESVDRNFLGRRKRNLILVALRKESVDRNPSSFTDPINLSDVALRKESVDRNDAVQIVIVVVRASLSARRAWIEIARIVFALLVNGGSLSARRAWIEIH